MTDPTTSTNPQMESLKKIFGMTSFIVNETTKDFTEADGLFHEEAGGNCANWILGHIVYYRMSYTRALGGSAPWPEEKGAQYARGTKGTLSAPEAIPYSELLQAFNDSQTALLAAFDNLGDSGLNRPSKNQRVFDDLLFLLMHESYHCGQLGLIRRLLGKVGVIK